MEYFRRYNPDGSCVVICLRCFSTIGTAGNLSAALTLENVHACTRHTGLSQKQSSIEIQNEVQTSRGGLSGRLLSAAAHLQMPYLPLLFLGIFLLLYAFPTLVEFAAVHFAAPAIGLVLFGNLVGCICLATVLRKPFLAGVLYLLLTICELWLHSSFGVRRVFLPWILDLIPTLVVAGRIAWMRAHIRTSHLQLS